MNETIFSLALSAMLFALCLPVNAQPPKKVPKIGYLGTTSELGASPNFEAFRQGLRELGYVEGQNIAFEHRHADGKYDRLPHLAAELVRLSLDLIFAPSTAAALAARDATQTISIVFASVADPVGSGLVASLARPGGNVTGLSQMAADLGGKRLELLKEVIPRLSRVAVLQDRSDPTPDIELKETRVAAQAFGVKLQILEVRGPGDFDSAFLVMARERPSALVVISSPTLLNQRKRIVDLATKHRLPAVYRQGQYVDAGGLMSYGMNLADNFRRAAIYVDKILKGTKPADLPVEQPTKFELVINLKTAKQIGLTIPPQVLARADKVIR